MWRAYPFLSEGVEPGWLWSTRDVTEYRHLQSRLIQSDKPLIGRFSAAHEINNPLTGIMCFSELLEQGGLDDGAFSKVRK